MPCKCPQCSQTPSRTWTPAWRLECEARWLLGLTLDARREHLAHPLVQARAEALKAEILLLHGKRR